MLVSMIEPGTLNRMARDARQQASPSQSAAQLAAIRQVAPASQNQIERAANMSWSVFTDIAAALDCVVNVTISNGANIHVSASTERHRSIREAIEAPEAATQAAADLLTTIDADLDPHIDRDIAAMFLRAAFLHIDRTTNSFWENCAEDEYGPTEREAEDVDRSGFGVGLSRLATDCAKYRDFLHVATIPRDQLTEDDFAEMALLRRGSLTVAMTADMHRDVAAAHFHQDDWAAWEAYIDAGSPHVSEFEALGERIATDVEYRDRVFHDAGWGGAYVPRSERRQEAGHVG